MYIMKNGHVRCHGKAGAQSRVDVLGPDERVVIQKVRDRRAEWGIEAAVCPLETGCKRADVQRAE